MPTPVPERDMKRASEMRKLAQRVRDPIAKRQFGEAADRLEKRAAKSVRKVGVRRKRGSNARPTATRLPFAS